jgi:hypothetical protein
MSKRKTADKFKYDDIAKYSDALSIISASYGRKDGLGFPSAKTDYYLGGFIASWLCEVIFDDIACLQWQGEKIEIDIYLENIYWARYENKKPITQAAHDKATAKAYQLGGELTAAGFHVNFR